MDKLGFSPEEVAQSLGLHVNTVLKFLRGGRIPGVRFGRRWVIPAKALAEYLAAPQNNNPTGLGGGR